MTKTGPFHLRLLATSDIHMHVLPYDYRRDAPVAQRGLSGLVDVIAQARAEAAGGLSVLLDNGDFLQGTPLAETMAAQMDPSPLQQIFAQLHYDAIGLGNHEFDFGLPYLERFVRGAPAPVLCSNFPVSGVQSELILERQLAGHPLHIGVLSVLPPQTAIWNSSHLGHLAPPGDMVAAAQQHVASLRQRGADVVVLLAHTGLAPRGAREDENAARALAQIPGIDAMVCGHTHRRLPGPDHHGWPDVDATAGYVGPVPAVMPGYAASDLGVIDLTLARQDGQWRAVQGRSALRTNSGLCDAGAEGAIAAAHNATVARQGEVIGHAAQPVQSFFAALQPDVGQHWVAGAIRAEVAKALPDAPHPILAAVAPNAVSGRGGPSNYLNLAAGPVLRRHVAAILPYPNRIWVLQVTGRIARDWAEVSACFFAQQGPGPAQALVNPAFASFNFDALFGLDAVIDPTRPAAFDAAGRRVPGGGRVVSLRFEGQEITDTQTFLLGTTSYRAAGGGGFPGTGAPVLKIDTSVTDALVAYLAAAHAIGAAPWRLATSSPVRAWIDTSPEAEAHLYDIAARAPHVLARTAEGFLRVEVTV